MPLIYTKHMTPQWLNNDRNVSVDWNVDGVIEENTVLRIPADSSNFEKIASVELIDSGITNNSDAMKFHIRASLEHTSPIIERPTPRPPQPRRRDPLSIMISDGSRAVGIQIQDPEDYDDIGPYIGIEGDSGNILTNINRYVSQIGDVDKIPATERRRWPQLFEITITVNNKRRFNECSASCISSVRGGTSISSTFARTLNSQGRWDLELYRGERDETYSINFLDVSVYVENDFIESRTW